MRKRFSERQVIETLIWQGITVPCFRCGAPLATIVEGLGFLWAGLPEREHVHELALGGQDTPENCRYSCMACHAKITNGTKATTAGSSKHKIAKIKRILGLTKNGPKKKIPGRPFQKVKRGFRPS